MQRRRHKPEHGNEWLREMPGSGVSATGHTLSKSFTEDTDSGACAHLLCASEVPPGRVIGGCRVTCVDVACRGEHLLAVQAGAYSEPCGMFRGRRRLCDTNRVASSDLLPKISVRVETSISLIRRRPTPLRVQVLSDRHQKFHPARIQHKLLRRLLALRGHDITAANQRLDVVRKLLIALIILEALDRNPVPRIDLSAQ